MSTQQPLLEKPETWSLTSLDPTVIASGSDAGDWLHASPAELPADTTAVSPAVIAFCTMSLSGL